MDDIKGKILDNLLEIAANKGWNNASLAAATESSGYDKKYSEIYFSEGISQAINMLAERFDAEMQEKITATDFASMRVRDRIAAAVMIRLGIYDKHKVAIRKLVAWYSMPQNAGKALASMGHTVDKIWYAAGDNSTDYNYYTKRMLLAGVYSSTLLFWLNDDSPDMQKTREFLGRRIDNVMSINKIKSKLSSFRPFSYG